MASETALSESAVNKSVDEKMEGPLLQKTMDELDVLKVVGDSPVLDSKDKEKLKEAEIPEIKENGDSKEQTLVNEGLNDEKVADEADDSKTVDDSRVLDFKDTEMFREEKTPSFKENEIPNEQATVNEGIDIEKVQDEAEVSRPVDISSISNSKDRDILKEEEGIEAKKIEPLKEQQIVESAKNEIPNEQATVTEGISIEKAQDETEVSRSVDISSLSDFKDKDILKEEEGIDFKETEPTKEQKIVESSTNEISNEQATMNEGISIKRAQDEAEVSRPVDISSMSHSKDNDILKEEEGIKVKEIEPPKEQQIVESSTNKIPEKAQDEDEVSRPVDISSISLSKEKDILKEEEGIEVKEIEPPKEQQIVESATNETLEIPKTLKVEETKPPKDEETEISTKEDFMNAQESNIPKEVEANKGATEGSSNEEEIPVVPGDGSAKKQDILEDTEKKKLKEEETPELAEKEKTCEQINKNQTLTEKGNEEPSKVVEEDKLKNEAFESAEGDRDEEATVIESTEVQIPVVAGAESKTEDVPAGAVTKDAAKPTARRSTDIFRHVGSKMMQMVHKMRNAITRKSSNGKVAK